MLIWSTVSRFVITEILHKWILTTFQDEQNSIGFFVCLVCVCVCLIKIVSVLIVYTRCILKLISNYMLLQFFYAQYSLLYWRFYTIFLHWDGQSLLGFQVPYKKLRKQLIVLILASCFSQRETRKITNNQPVQKFYNNNFVWIFYLFIISILCNSHIRLWTISLFFSVVSLQMQEPIFPFSEMLWIIKTFPC